MLPSRNKGIVNCRIVSVLFTTLFLITISTVTLGKKKRLTYRKPTPGNYNLKWANLERLERQMSINSTRKIRQEDLSDVDKILHFDESSITFVASNTSANPINMINWKKKDQFSHVAQLSSQFKPELNLLKGSKSPKRILPSQGFFYTVFTAYNHHHNLVISPDDIWTAIIIQFSLYVNANAEELRHRFVTHKGKKDLIFPVTSEDGSSEKIRWASAFSALESQLKDATNPEMSQFITNNFTTTTELTRIVSTLVFMSTLQQYFTFKYERLCGIPHITILGDVKDYEEISRRVEFLKTFGEVPSKWSNILAPIIRQFINAKKGQIDSEFWGDIVMAKKEQSCGSTYTRINGWVTAFSLFKQDGSWNGMGFDPSRENWPAIYLRNAASGVVTVPVLIDGRKNGTILVGHMGHSVSSDKLTLTPYTGWAVTTLASQPMSTAAIRPEFFQPVPVEIYPLRRFWWRVRGEAHEIYTQVPLSPSPLFTHTN